MAIPQPIAINGLVSTADINQDLRNLDFSSTIALLNINGDTPLTGLTALMRKSRVSDPVFRWYSKVQSQQAADVRGIFEDQALTTAINGPITDGQFFWLTADVGEFDEFRPGHTVTITPIADYAKAIVCRVVNRVLGASGTQDAVQLYALQASAAGVDVSVATHTRIIIIGNSNPEGGVMPMPIVYEARPMENSTQIFRNTLEITRTLLQTELKQNPQKYQEMRQDITIEHALEMEKTFLFGRRSFARGYNGKPERTTQGLVEAIRQYGIYSNAQTNTLVPGAIGDPFVQWGRAYLQALLPTVFEYGSNQKLAFAGNGALAAIQELIQDLGYFTYDVTTTAYGLRVNRWVTAFGEILIKTHPLFNLEPAFRNSMIIFEPAKISYKYIQDTIYKKDNWRDIRLRGYDGLIEEYLTEAGLMYEDPYSWTMIDGLGLPKLTDSTRIFAPVGANLRAINPETASVWGGGATAMTDEEYRINNNHGAQRSVLWANQSIQMGPLTSAIADDVIAGGGGATPGSAQIPYADPEGMSGDEPEPFIQKVSVPNMVTDSADIDTSDDAPALEDVVDMKKPATKKTKND